MMTVAFFWVRVVFYGYMIFNRVRHWHFLSQTFTRNLIQKRCSEISFTSA